MFPTRLTIRRWTPRAAIVSLLTLCACATEPPPAPAAASPPVPPDTTVYFYPTSGRPPPSVEQQNRDRYECNSWAVQHSGFDPSLPTTPPHQRVQVVAGGPPPGTDVAVGAVGGALIGGAVSSPWDTGPGILVGALAGAVIGGAVDAERANQVRGLQAEADAENHAAGAAALERGAADYRRAMEACLEGHGYTVG